MEYRAIGKTGVKVSNLCMGTMSFGGIADGETSKKMFDRARETGINFQMFIIVEGQKRFLGSV